MKSLYLSPKKRLGQHFLQDPGVIHELLQALHPSPSDIFIEIGPGLGALTLPLLTYGAQTYAIEFDADVIPILRDKTKQYPHFQCIQADATQFDFNTIFMRHLDQKIRIVGNLPYNVCTPIIFHIWNCIEHLGDMTFLLQKEVVNRMVAECGSRAYGRLAMMTRYYAMPEALFEVAPSAFHPPPKVDSQFVQLHPRSREERLCIDPSTLELWVKQLFQFPRKTVFNNLKAYCTAAELEAAGIHPQDRPQEMSLEQLIRLIKIVSALDP